MKHIPLTNHTFIFPYWTGMLDVISSALGSYIFTLNFSMVRIDGSFTLQQRRDALDRFNSEESCVIMITSIGATGEGFVLHLN
jgi:SNF2 family DNA or RNA helicase